MAELERLVAKIEADLTGLKAGLAQADKLTATVAGKMERSFSNIERVLLGVRNAMVGAFSVGAVVQATRTFSDLQVKSIQAASGLKDVALQAGFSTTALQQLQYAGTQLGLTDEQISGSLTKLSRNIGTARAEGMGAVPVFERLGVSLTDSAGAAKTNEQVFRDVVEQLKKIPDPAIRGAEAVELFGREAGPKFQELIAGGTAGLDEWAAAANRAGAVMDESFIDAMKRTNDELEALNKQISVNMTQAFGSATPIVMYWKELMAALTARMAEAAQQQRDTAAATSFFGEKAADASGNIVNFMPVAEDYLGVLQDIEDRYVNISTMAPLRLPDVPVSAAIPLRGDLNVPAAAKGKTPEQEAAEKAAKETLEARLQYQRDYQQKLNDLEAQRVNDQIGWDDQRQKEFEDANERAEKELERSLELRRQTEMESTFGRIGFQMEAAENLLKFEKLNNQQRLASSVDLAQGLLSTLGQTSKKAFQVSKALAIAEAIVNTYRAATAAFANSGGNIYVGIAKAAVALAYGFAQVRAIQSTQFGGGGPGGAVGGARTVTGQLDEQGGGRRELERTIILQGLDPNSIYSGRQLVDLFNQARADGATIRTGT